MKTQGKGKSGAVFMKGNILRNLSLTKKKKKVFDSEILSMILHENILTTQFSTMTQLMLKTALEVSHEHKGFSYKMPTEIIWKTFLILFYLLSTWDIPCLFTTFFS